jgi:hypothetical protein
MPLNLLLLTSLKRETHIVGYGTTVSMTPNSDEKVLFFDLDKDECAIKKLLLGQADWQNKKICDGLVFFSNSNGIVFCLVELKGEDVNHAKDQLINTQKFLQCYLEGSLRKSSVGRDLLQKIQWRAYILQNRSASSPSRKSNPDKIKKHGDIYKELNDHFEKFDIRKQQDIGDFIRA